MGAGPIKVKPPAPKSDSVSTFATHPLLSGSGPGSSSPQQRKKLLGDLLYQHFQRSPTLDSPHPIKTQEFALLSRASAPQRNKPTQPPNSTVLCSTHFCGVDFNNGVENKHKRIQHTLYLRKIRFSLKHPEGTRLSPSADQRHSAST
jgi:hypothetical protein